MDAGSNLGGRALKQWQCTQKGQAKYVNVQGSVNWNGVYRVEQVDTGDAKFFKFCLLKFTKQK